MSFFLSESCQTDKSLNFRLNFQVLKSFFFHFVALKTTLNQLQFVFLIFQTFMLSISVVIVCSLKVESQIHSFKICEELSAEQMHEEAQICNNKTLLFMS